ncbi:peptidoglycan D,D-transpeptidase FtsI family protein [Arachnia propionica]|uniref:peptidoglycan D,D-transpeptidase FtsI family protein n=1 Tax=Arachnia propionica TaxID=1750 RepID=UPI0037BFF142
MGRSRFRIRVFMLALTVMLMGCVVRAVQLQAFDSQAFAAEAAAKMQNTRDLLPERGYLVDRNGVVLAGAEAAMRVTVDPDQVQTNGADKRYAMSEKKQQEAEAAPAAVAKILATHLGGSEEEYLEILLKENSRYEVVARKVPAATWMRIEADMRKGIDGDGKRRWYGLYAEPDPIRTYPSRTLASNVIGFVNGEGTGMTGLEGSLDQELAGTVGSEVYDRSTYGRIPLGTNVLTPPVNGNSYTLTLDADLQWFAEQRLAESIRQSGAATGVALVMNVNNGEILALANAPSFDSSKPGDADVSDLGNRAVSAAYEPGSTQKVLTMAALADSGLVTPDTQLTVPSRIASGGGYVSDSFEHGTIQLTARGVVAQSSNIGTIQLARQLDKDKLHSYLTEFGLGSKPGSGLPAETAGQLPAPDMADYTRDQISFGQGLSVSAVQMAGALSAAVNGGVYHQPHVLRSASQADGTPIALAEPTSRRVISKEASSMVVEMMESVITGVGDGERAIPGYRTAGKSGTAQRYDANCRCYNGYTASFVGVAPAENPQILVYVVLDRPTNGNLGSQLALPVVNSILQMSLPRYNVLPSTTPARNEPLTWE